MSVSEFSWIIHQQHDRACKLRFCSPQKLSYYQPLLAFITKTQFFIPAYNLSVSNWVVGNCYHWGKEDDFFTQWELCKYINQPITKKVKDEDF